MKINNGMSLMIHKLNLLILIILVRKPLVEKLRGVAFQIFIMMKVTLNKEMLIFFFILGNKNNLHLVINIVFRPFLNH